MSFIQHLRESEQRSFKIEQLFEAKSGAAVARELGISRQAVKKTLHRAVGKVYASIRAMPDIKDDAFQAFVMMTQILNVGDSNDPKDIREVFDMLPSKDKEDIEKIAKEKYNIDVKKGM